MQWWDGGETLPDRVRAAGFDIDDPIVNRIVTLARELVVFPGFPRHLSQHVGGFVICEGVLEELVPIEKATMADRTVVPFSMGTSSSSTPSQMTKRSEEHTSGLRSPYQVVFQPLPLK